MARFDQAIRVVKLLLLLSKRRHGMSLEEIKAEFKVSRRTVYRDIECLRFSGLEIATLRNDGSVRWVLEDPKTKD